MNILGQPIIDSGDKTFFGNIETTQNLIIQKKNIVESIEDIEDIQVIQKSQREILLARIEDLELSVEFLKNKVIFLSEVIENLTEITPTAAQQVVE